MQSDREGGFSNSPPLPDLGPVLDFMRLMWAVDHALQRTSKRMEVDLGVTGPQRLVLRLIGRFPGVSAGQLATTLHVHPSTLTGIMKRLGRRGLVQRRRDLRDRRRSLFGLTKKGRQMDLETEGTIEAAVQTSLSGLSRETVDAARQVLGELARALELERPPAEQGTPQPARRPPSYQHAAGLKRDHRPRF